MKMVVQDGLKIGWAVAGLEAGQLSACFAVKGTYQLKPNQAAVPAPEADQLSGDRYVDDDAAKALYYPGDLIPPKQRADLLLHAVAHAPNQQPAPRFNVRWQVAGFNKVLLITGERKWVQGLLRAKPGAPLPIAQLPITYENAWGGPDFSRNPIGRGRGQTGFPNVESPSAASSGRIEMDPAGFAPLHPFWDQRRSLLGTYDEKWLKERWPWYPADFDFAYFNAAPSDQRLGGFLRGDEPMEFENLHAEMPIYRTRLPGIRPRVFIQERDRDASLQFREVPLQLDTLWIDMPAQKMVLVWHGAWPVRHIKMKQIEEVLAWSEPVAGPPLTEAEYRHILAHPPDEEEDEPEPPEPPDDAAKVEAEFAALDLEIAALDKQAVAMEADAARQLLDEKARLAAQGLEMPAAASDPMAGLQAALTQPGMPLDQVADIQALMAEAQQMEAEAAAMDLEFAQDFPPDPTRESLVAMAARGESLAEADLSEMDLSGQNLAKADLRDASLRKTKLVKANLAGANLSGANLAEADLTDADLSGAILDEADLGKAKLAGAKLTGLSLNGVDFSQVMLAGADFSGGKGDKADFSGADLSKACLAGVHLPAADFSGCKLAQADCQGAVLTRASFESAKAPGINLETADLTGASADKADLTGANLRGAVASRIVFEGALLNDADFTRAILTRGMFAEALLRGACFERADLTLAVFDDAILEKAVLTQANLLRASFERADLTQADCRGANCYEAGFWMAITNETAFESANLRGTTLG